jgi:hypothetical protein
MHFLDQPPLRPDAVKVANERCIIDPMIDAIILHRTAKNMRRFYRLDVQPDLFGQATIERADASSYRPGSGGMDFGQWEPS